MEILSAVSGNLGSIKRDPERSGHMLQRESKSVLPSLSKIKLGRDLPNLDRNFKP